MRKIRRWAKRIVWGVVLVALIGSLGYNAATAPAGVGPRDAGVPGEFVEVGGSLTHYETAGSGDTPIVLLHGFGLWSFSWRPLLAILGADPRFTAYAPDMRGFGFTERPPDTLYTPAAYARHVEEFIDALELDRPILVGHSLGGDVALRVALNRPDRIRGLVLEAPAASINPVPWQEAIVRVAFIPPFNRTAIRLLTRPGFLRAGLERTYVDKAAVNIDEVVVNVRRPLEQRGAEDALIAMTRTRRDAVAPERVASLRLPTLIVWGEGDPVIPLDTGRRLHTQIAASQLVVYPRTGHTPHEEERERFATDVLTFAGRLAAP